MNITVYCASSEGNRPVYREAAVELGEWIAQNGHILIYGAGRYGLMGALAGAVKENGGKVIGVIPRFLDSREGHRDDLDQLEYVDSMTERKTRMIELGDAFIALPGGVGTLEEIAEIMSLKGLHRLSTPCIFYSVDGFYKPLEAMLQTMENEGMLSTPYAKNIAFCSSLTEIDSLF